MKWNNPFKGKTTEEKTRQDYEKALRYYEKLKNQWTKDDEKTRAKVIDAILKILQDGGIESYEDDECTIPTTKEHLQDKDLAHLIDDFETILRGIRGQIE